MSYPPKTGFLWCVIRNEKIEWCGYNEDECREVAKKYRGDYFIVPYVAKSTLEWEADEAQVAALRTENAALKKRLEELEWVDVKERLPEQTVEFNFPDGLDGKRDIFTSSQYVLGMVRDGYGDSAHEVVAYEARNGWKSNRGEVTHWMPLPPPPSTKEGQCGISFSTGFWIAESIGKEIAELERERKETKCLPKTE